MNTVVLSLGSNIDNRGYYITSMLSEVSSMFIGEIQKSRLMETEPVGVDEHQKWYYNIVLAGKYRDSVFTLLHKCQEIEQKLKRSSKGEYRPRTADIDILLFNNEIINQDNLVVPHPRIMERKFCLKGLKQILPEMEFPGTGKKVSELYSGMEISVKKQKIRYID